MLGTRHCSVVPETERFLESARDAGENTKSSAAVPEAATCAATGAEEENQPPTHQPGLDVSERSRRDLRLGRPFSQCELGVLFDIQCVVEISIAPANSSLKS